MFITPAILSTLFTRARHNFAAQEDQILCGTVDDIFTFLVSPNLLKSNSLLEELVPAHPRYCIPGKLVMRMRPLS